MNRVASASGVALVLALAACGGERGPEPTPCTTLEGSVTISNSADWTALVDNGCTSITGNLTINATGLVGPLSAPALESVGGSLDVAGNDALTSFSLPALTTVVGKYLDIRWNAALPECLAIAFKDHLVAAHGFTGTWTISGNNTIATCPP
jgi:hypothetical protein